MFRLLTEESRIKVEHEYKMRRIVVILCAFMMVAVVGIVGIMPSYVLSNARANDVIERNKIVSTTNTSTEDNELKKWLVGKNLELKTLSFTKGARNPSEYVEKVLEEKISGISIHSFVWSEKEDEPSLVISGVAANRQTLINFENQINDSGEFSKVSLPLSNLARDRDLDFQLSLNPIEKD